ncbi:MBL fold metallo-hydrolase [Halobacteriovorax marinus]|uniref:MBL fold metallo-hydrolase n=1 Tax=Halobacteriovorax marinus TaxID=97084 RepID=UPI000BDE6719|nr:MBL fold metallo-hydrolase [Halobacteriovorax marinus]
MTNLKNKMTILGSGTSTGIPMVGCDCAVCTSTVKENTRLRTSVYLETAQASSILIDTTPDLRHQLLKHKINKVDFAFITHDHADHTHGIDDLRPLTFAPKYSSIPIYTYKRCAAQLTQKFPYIFKAKQLPANIGGGIPNLQLMEVDLSGQQKIGAELFEFTMLDHGYTQTLGIIHEKMAYIIDCHQLSSEQIEDLRKRELELLIIDCVTNHEHKTHLWQERTFEYISQIAPKRAGLIHMNHALEHEQLKKDAAASFSFEVFPTYDGQVLYY